MNEVTKLPEWKILFDKYKDRDYGSVITYEEMNKALPEGDILTNKRHVLTAFKREMLRGEQKLLECLRNIGYRIANPDEHTRFTQSEINKAHRRTSKGAEIIGNVNYSMLNDKDKAKANLIATRVQGIAAALLAEKVAIKEINVKYELPYMPNKR